MRRKARTRSPWSGPTLRALLSTSRWGTPGGLKAPWLLAGAALSVPLAAILFRRRARS